MKGGVKVSRNLGSLISDWDTVCDDGFTNNAVKVACHQLEYYCTQRMRICSIMLGVAIFYLVAMVMSPNSTGIFPIAQWGVTIVHTAKTWVLTVERKPLLYILLHSLLPSPQHSTAKGTAAQR